MFESIAKFLTNTSNAIKGTNDFINQRWVDTKKTAGDKISNFSNALESREAFGKYLSENIDKGKSLNFSKHVDMSHPDHISAPDAGSLLANLQNM
jgi:hypothetical protein